MTENIVESLLTSAQTRADQTSDELDKENTKLIESIGIKYGVQAALVAEVSTKMLYTLLQARIVLRPFLPDNIATEYYADQRGQYVAVNALLLSMLNKKDSGFLAMLKLLAENELKRNALLFGLAEDLIKDLSLAVSCNDEKPN